MTREDKRAYNYARDRLANDDYPVYSDEYELELAYKAGIEDAKNHPHWISVEDELPKVDMLIFVVQLGKVTTFRYQYDRAEVLKNVFGITHWMPLPEAPKEGGRE